MVSENVWNVVSRRCVFIPLTKSSHTLSCDTPSSGIRNYIAVIIQPPINNGLANVFAVENAWRAGTEPPETLMSASWLLRTLRNDPADTTVAALERNLRQIHGWSPVTGGEAENVISTVHTIDQIQYYWQSISYNRSRLWVLQLHSSTVYGHEKKESGIGSLLVT